MDNSTIKWLHVSDFHIGMDNYAQRKLLSEIVKFVSLETKNRNIFDFVFITGDVANKGLSDEYEIFFEEFLVPLGDALGEDWDGRIFSVPGNHDIDRRLARYFDPRSILENEKDFFDPTVEGQIRREQFFSRFQAFSEAMKYSQSPKDWIESESGIFEVLVPHRAGDVLIVGVNTAWLSKDDSDRHRLTPGSHALEDALTRNESAPVKIVLGHHPLGWLDDQELQRIQSILSRHSAIYLCGHLHANDIRYEDGGAGAFVSLRSGAAFQGREDDNPKWVNGFQTVELDLSKREMHVRPFHWSSNHREWKLSSDAFPNSRKNPDGNCWSFPLPFAHQITNESDAVPQSSNIAMTVPAGWSIVDTLFLAAQDANQNSKKVLHFFDGRPPDWSIATSRSVPRREIVRELRDRFFSLQGALRPAVVVLLGAGGEGKSTCFLQSLADLVRNDSWTVIWHSGDEQPPRWSFVEHCAARFDRVIIASDDAHSLTDWLVPTLEKLRARSKQNVHFLLCARSIDWRSEATKNHRKIVETADYQEIMLRGLDENDASALVEAWSKFGKEGLNELFGLTRGAATERLLAAAKDISLQSAGGSAGEDGVLLGAMLQIRYGDKLKDKVRSILYRLREMSSTGSPLLEAFAMIAAMHAEDLVFLSEPVLAEALSCSRSELRRKILVPLADEAVAAGGGRFILCRHRQIAKAAVEILRETNLFGDIDSVFPILARAAVVARRKGEFVPDLHSWDYALPEHFDKAKPMLSVQIAETLLEADPTDYRLRVNLSKTYRNARDPQRAVELFEDYGGDFPTRAMWTEWGVAKGNCGDDPYAAVAIISVAISDLPKIPPPNRSDSRSLAALAYSLWVLYERTSEETYRAAVLAACEMGLKIVGDETTKAILEERYRKVFSKEYSLDGVGQWIANLTKAISAVAEVVDIGEISHGRISRGELTNFRGITSLVQHSMRRQKV